MLSISKPRSAGSLAEYHKRDYGAAQSSAYYMESKDGKLRPVEIYGRLAVTFGIEGYQVNVDHFDRLANGQHPITGKQLIKWRDMKAKEVPAWAAEISSSSPDEAKKQLAAREAAWKEHLGDIYLKALDGGHNPIAADFTGGTLKESSRRFTQKNPPQKELTERQATLVEMHEKAAALYRANLNGPAGEKARAYLAGRGITPELAAEFGLGLAVGRKQLADHLAEYGPEMLKASGLVSERGGQFYDRFRERLMFPIHDERKRTIAFAGRAMDQEAAEKYGKYINSAETEIYKKSNVLYNLNRAKDAIAEARQVVLKEGYMDVIAAHGAGVRNVVGVCGTELTGPMAKRIGEIAPKALLAFDNDEAGIDATKRHAPSLLAEGVDVSVLTISKWKDAAEFIEKEGADAYRREVGEKPVPFMAWAFDGVRQIPVTEFLDRAQGTRDIVDMFQSVPPERREEFAANWSRYLNVPVPEESLDKEKGVKKHRAAWDLTFNAPKSISITGLVGGDSRIVDAHRLAVRYTLQYGERLVQARMGGNNQPETTGKWIVFPFDHDTARPVDGYAAAHLHTHAVLFNMTEDSTGKMRSLQTHELYRCAPMMTAIYRNILETKLREFGYEIEWKQTSKRGDYYPEIVGYTPEYLASESKRAEKIRNDTDAAGMVGAKAREVAAHADRESKLNLSPEEVRAMHLANAEKFGNQPQQVVAEAAQRIGQEMAEYPSAVARRSVDYARAVLSDNSSVFEYFAVLTEALNEARGGCTLEDIEREFANQKEAGQFIRVHHVRPNAPLARFTTPELRANEEIGILTVHRGQGKAEPMGCIDKINAAALAKLNEDQRAAVGFVSTSTDQIIGLRGRAGTGKNTTLRALDEMSRSAGFTTHGLGTTSRARKGLKEAGIEAETLQKFLIRADAAPGAKRLFFMDETSLASGRQMRKFFERLRPEDRVILVGDERQHGSVEAGRIFWTLQQAGMHCVTLSKIMRQKDPELLKAVESLARGDVKVGIGLLDEQKRITTAKRRGNRFDAIARDYAASPDGTLVVSPDNQSRKEINEAIRARLQSKGVLGEDVYKLHILVQRNNVSETARTSARSYSPDDVLLYRKGSAALGIKAGEYATVMAVDAGKNEITVRRADGGTVAYDPAKCSGVSIYEIEVRGFAVGDRVQFTSPHKKMGVDNRDNGVITALDEYGNVVVALDEGGTRRFNFRNNKHVEHGYVSTSHASQGDTVRRVLIHVDTGDSRIRNLITETFAYVATSRAWQDARIYTDDASKLVQELSRHEQQYTALSPKEIKTWRGMVA